MKTEQKPAEVLSAPSQTNVPEPARRPWTVNFVVPTPKSMPSQRLKARAELVRKSQGCSTY